MKSEVTCTNALTAVKTISAILLAVCLCLSICPTGLAAYYSAPVSIERTGGGGMVFAPAPAASIAPRSGNSVYGYNYFATQSNGDKLQALYYQMYLCAEQFAASASDVDDSLLIGTFNTSDYGVSTEEAVAVWLTFRNENPMYYWLSDTVLFNGNVLVLTINAAYKLRADRVTFDAQINSMLSEFGGSITTSMSELEIALAAHDFLINRISYAYESDGTTPQDDEWAHSIIGAVNGSGVCESYAKAFMSLCLCNNLDSIVVAGYSQSQSHMWNLVEIDGIWYGVDVTYDDAITTGGAISYDFFGMSNEGLNADHSAYVPTSSGISYGYGLPEVSEDCVQLVKLYKGTEYIHRCVSIDAAFAEMTDTGAEYTVETHIYPRVGDEMLLSVSSVEHIIKSAQTPNVAKLTLRGENIDLGGGYTYTARARVVNDLTLGSDLVFINFGIEAALQTSNGYHYKDINIGGHTVRFEGFSYYVNFNRLHGGAGSKIISTNTGAIDITGTIDVETIETNGEIVIRGPEFHVKEYTSNGFVRFFGSVLKVVKIENAYVGQYSLIQTQACESTEITIGNIIGNNNFQYALLSISCYPSENLPMITITGEIIDTKLYYNFCGTDTSIFTDMSGNEVSKYVYGDSLDANTVIFNAVNLDYSDFYCVQEQEETPNAEGTAFVDEKMHYVDDASKVLSKKANGDFVFLGWDNVVSTPASVPSVPTSSAAASSTPASVPTSSAVASNTSSSLVVIPSVVSSVPVSSVVASSTPASVPTSSVVSSRPVSSAAASSVPASVPTSSVVSSTPVSSAAASSAPASVPTSSVASSRPVSSAAASSAPASAATSSVVSSRPVSSVAASSIPESAPVSSQTESLPVSEPATVEDCLAVIGQLLPQGVTGSDFATEQEKTEAMTQTVSAIDDFVLSVLTKDEINRPEITQQEARVIEQTYRDAYAAANPGKTALIDLETGISMKSDSFSGSEQAVITAEKLPEDEVYREALEMVESGETLFAYDIKIDGSVPGPKELTFRLPGFEGKKVVIAHKTDSGEWETFKATVSDDGFATITVTTLSPFVGYIDSAPAVNPLFIYIGLAFVAVAGIITAVLLLRRKASR